MGTESPIPPNSPVSTTVSIASVDLPEFRADHNPASADRPDGTSTMFEWSCTEWEETDEDPIVQLINPSQVRWSIPFRRTRGNVFGGTVIQDWKSPDGSSLDLPSVSITLNTGRLYPVTFFSREDAFSKASIGGTVKLKPLSASEKATVFYRFCRLCAMPAFTTATGSPNLVTLKYRTILLPEIDMRVKFMEPLTFMEDARNPYNVEYSIGLLVLAMSPPLSSLQQLGLFS